MLYCGCVRGAGETGTRGSVQGRPAWLAGAPGGSAVSGTTRAHTKFLARHATPLRPDRFVGIDRTPSSLSSLLFPHRRSRFKTFIIQLAFYMYVISRISQRQTNRCAVGLRMLHWLRNIATSTIICNYCTFIICTALRGSVLLVIKSSAKKTFSIWILNRTSESD